MKKTKPEIEIEICIDYRLSRIVKVTTDGGAGTDASMNGWKEEYESRYMTPVEIIEALKKLLPSLLDHYYDTWRNTADKKQAVDVANKLSTLQAISWSVDGWDETFEEAMEI